VRESGRQPDEEKRGEGEAAELELVELEELDSGR